MEVETDPEWHRPLPLRFADDGVLIDAVSRRLPEVGASLAEIDPDRLVRTVRRKFLTTRQPVLRGQMHRLLALDQLNEDSAVRRRKGSICVLEDIDGELSVLLGDRELRMPAWVEPAISRLATGDATLVGDLPGLDETGRVVLVRRLIREGLLEVLD
jgi:hypothetical protein